MLANWIRMSTTTPGPGPLTVAGVTGYPDVTSQLATNERAAYVLLDSSELPIERGIGYWNGSAWVREVVIATYVSGVYTGANPSAATLAAGTKYLIVSPGAQTVLTSKQGIWANTVKCYGEQAVAGAAGTLTLTADRAYAVPAYCAVDSDIDAVLFRVTTAGAAGKLAKGAIYSVGSNGLPGVKLAEGASVAVDSTGNKVSSFTRFRPPPTFFICLVCDGAPVVTSYSSGILMSNAMGCDGTLSMAAFIHHVGATLLTFPSTWTPVANVSNAARPALFVRCP